MAFQLLYPITPILAPAGSKRRPGRPVTPAVKFLVAHDTGNPDATAVGHARWYRNDPNPKVVSSAHLFVDDTSIVETIPAFVQAEQALHVLYSVENDNLMFGHDANRAAIGVEYCYGPHIDADAAYARYVWVLARLCDVHGLDPARCVVGHSVLDPGRKHDPQHGLSASNRSYDQLLKDVVRVFKACGGAASAVGATLVKPGPIVTSVWLQLRQGPARDAAAIRKMAPGTHLVCQDIVPGEPVEGVDLWCQTSEGYCWSGGVTN